MSWPQKARTKEKRRSTSDPEARVIKQFDDGMRSYNVQIEIDANVRMVVR